MKPWLQGKFGPAAQKFAEMRARTPEFAGQLLWESEFEIERAHFGQAAALIREAEVRSTGGDELPQRRFARLFFSVGRFSDAQQKALFGHRWDSNDVQRLKVSAPMALVTIGEVYLAKGRYSEAMLILEKALANAKNTSSIDGLEWVRAENDIALANLGTSSLPKAAESANRALSAAEHEWGRLSIPAMDSMDTLGLVRLAESNFHEAEQLFSTSRAWREALYGTPHPKVAASYIHAALLAVAEMRNVDAARFITGALGIENNLAVGQPNGRWALSLVTGADVFERLGRIDDAKDCYKGALPILERELGADAPRVRKARKHYSELLQ